MASSAGAALFGPGMTDQEDCCRLLLPVLRQLGDVPVVLDALSLAVVEHDAAILRALHRTAVLTPNRQELGYMPGLGDGGIGDDARQAVRDAADRFAAVVSLGGGESLIAGPDGGLWQDSTGGIGLGVSGSGDCAAGIVAGLLARGAEPAQAAVWGAHLHGSAGDRLATRLGTMSDLRYGPRITATEVSWATSSALWWLVTKVRAKRTSLVCYRQISPSKATSSPARRRPSRPASSLTTPQSSDGQ